MTPGTAVRGAAPPPIATDAGAEARHEAGSVIVGSVGFGTIFMPFVVPVVYLLLPDKHEAVDEIVMAPDREAGMRGRETLPGATS